MATLKDVFEAMDAMKQAWEETMAVWDRYPYVNEELDDQMNALGENIYALDNRMHVLLEGNDKN